MALIERARTPLTPAVVVAALAFAPPAWLGWSAEVGAVLWIPLNPIAHVAASARSWLRPLTMTSAPSRARPRAAAKPMPAVEPVTSASLP